MDFDPLDVLPAASLDDLVENIEALADGSAISGLYKNLLTVDSNPYKFRAYRNASLTLSTGAQKVAFDAESYDTNSNFDITTNVGRYTAPVAGFYWFSATISVTQGNPYTYNALLYKNGSNIAQGTGLVSANSNSGQYTVNDLVQLSASDYVEIFASTSNPGGQGINVGSATTYFSGILMCRT